MQDYCAFITCQLPASQIEIENVLLVMIMIMIIMIMMIMMIVIMIIIMEMIMVIMVVMMIMMIMVVMLLNIKMQGASGCHVKVLLALFYSATNKVWVIKC